MRSSKFKSESALDASRSRQTSAGNGTVYPHFHLGFFYLAVRTISWLHCESL